MATTTYYPNSAGTPTIVGRTAGTAAKATSGNVTPGLPATWAADDIHICLITAKDNVACTMPAGWTLIAEANNGAGLRTTAFWRRAVAGDVDPLVTHTLGGYVVASIGGWRGCVTTGSPIDVAGTWQANASSATVAAAAITVVAADARLVFMGGTATRATFATYTGTPTPAERADAPNTASYPSHCIAESVFTPAGTTGARQCTASAAAVNNAILVSLKDGTGGAGWYGLSAARPSATLGLDTTGGFQIAALNTISVDDENFASYAGGAATYANHRVRFPVAENIGSLTAITPTFKGYSSAADPADNFFGLYIWNNNTSELEELGHHHTGSKDTVTGAKTANLSNYVVVNGSHQYVYMDVVGAVSEGTGQLLYTYFGTMVVTYTDALGTLAQVIVCT